MSQCLSASVLSCSQKCLLLLSSAAYFIFDCDSLSLFAFFVFWLGVTFSSVAICHLDFSVLLLPVPFFLVSDVLIHSELFCVTAPGNY